MAGETDTKEEGKVEIILSGDDEDIEEGEHEPPEDHPRFKVIYGRMKQYERDLATVTTTLKERDAAVDEMRAHNKRLAEALERGITAVSTKQEKDTTDDEITAKQAEITKLKEQKKDAIKDEDFELLDSLNEKIYDIKGEIKELSSKKIAEASKATQQSRMKQLSEDDSKTIQEFVKDTPWYTEDPVMKVAAIAVDGMLAQDPVWSTKPLKERLIETRKRVEKRFGVESKPPGGGPDGGGNQSGGTHTVVNLNADQIAVAKGLGLSNEEYAKQLNLIEKGVK